MISSSCLLVAILLLYIDQAISEEPCYGFLGEIYNQERAFFGVDSPPERTYTLCEDTLYEPGVLSSTGLESGDTPLTIYENAHVKCGSDGSSSNNCTITGTGTYGIFLVDGISWRRQGLGTIMFEGITISGFQQARQIPVVIAGESGNVTFKDCIFENLETSPLFYFDEIDYSEPSDGRRRNLFDEGFDTYNYLYDANMMLGGQPPRTLVSNSDRQITTNTTLTWTFQGCQFRNNVPINIPNAGSNAAEGSFLLTFRRTGVRGFSPQGFTSANVKLIDNKFFNNKNVKAQTKFSSIVLYNGTGELYMDNNCFEKTRAGQLGIVVVQKDAKVINENNFVDRVQRNIDCPFIAKVQGSNDLYDCGGEAKVAQCGTVAEATPNCFPGDATSEVEGVGEIMLKNLKLGDRVSIGNGQYQPVYSFGHRNTTLEMDYLKIVTKSSEIIISRDHMIFVEGGRSVPANHVKIGDKVLTVDGRKSLVEGVKTVRAIGAFAPFTASGSIVVNGIKASTFVSFQNSETLLLSGIDTGITYQFIGHTFELPHRLWCRYFSNCLEEEYDAHGISTRVALPHQIALWYLKQSDFIMTTFVVPVLALLFVLSIPFFSLSIMIAMMIIILRSKIYIKVK